MMAEEVCEGLWKDNAALLVMPSGADLPYCNALNGKGNDHVRGMLMQSVLQDNLSTCLQVSRALTSRLVGIMNRRWRLSITCVADLSGTEGHTWDSVRERIVQQTMWASGGTPLCT
jgi:hypothetical protein